MSALAYLASANLNAEALAKELDEAVIPAAEQLLAQGVEAAELEVLSEFLARWAVELGEQRVSAAQVEQGAAHLGLPAELRAGLAHAFARARDGHEMAALAVHLLDLGERVALLVYVPELPALTAKSDRTGDAARSVGVAKRLRG